MARCTHDLLPKGDCVHASAHDSWGLASYAFGGFYDKQDLPISATGGLDIPYGPPQIPYDPPQNKQTKRESSPDFSTAYKIETIQRGPGIVQTFLGGLEVVPYSSPGHLDFVSQPSPISSKSSLVGIRGTPTTTRPIQRERQEIETFYELF